MAIRTRTRSARLLLVALISVSLVTITLDYREGRSGPLAGLGHVAIGAMAPMQSAVSNVTRPIGNFLSGIAEIPTLRVENRRLQDELADARNQLTQDAAKQNQYQELVGSLRLANTVSPTQHVTAVVIANSPSNFEWTITINRGSGDGIAAGMPVIASQGLVGTVVQSTPNSALVRLIIDRRSAVAAKVGEQTGLLKGEGNADMQMDFVQSSAKIDPSQDPTVVTQSYRAGSFSSVFPSDIPIGTVSRVFDAPSGLSTSVLVRPAVDFSSLQYVTVLKTDVGS
jgi:rod shape-determining protein MreC